MAIGHLSRITTCMPGVSTAITFPEEQRLSTGIRPSLITPILITTALTLPAPAEAVWSAEPVAASEPIRSGLPIRPAAAV